MLELFMLLSGLWVLVTGKSMRKGCRLTGGKARIRGLLLIAPAVIAVAVLAPAVAYGFIGYPMPGLLIELALVIGFFVAQSAYSTRAVADIELDPWSEPSKAPED